MSYTGPTDRFGSPIGAFVHSAQVWAGLRTTVLPSPGPGMPSEVTIHGELDLATEAAFCEAITDVIVEHGPDVVVGMSGVAFCDARGLGAIVRSANHAAQAGGTLTLTGVSATLRRLLRVAGLEERLCAPGAVPADTGFRAPAVPPAPTARATPAAAASPVRRGGSGHHRAEPVRPPAPHVPACVWIHATLRQPPALSRT